MTVTAGQKSLLAQRGMATITVLMLIVLLALLLLSVMGGGLLDERMAGNLRSQNLAFQAAEAVLRDAESQLSAAPYAPDYLASAFSAGCANALCTTAATGSTPRWQTLDWSANSTTTRTFSGASPLPAGAVAQQPRYYVEVVTPPWRYNSTETCNPGIVRMTARGVGQTASTVVFVEATYRFIPNSC